MRPAASSPHTSPNPSLRICAASRSQAKSADGFFCSIYHHRLSTCREFDVLDADGNPNPNQRCAALRIGLGLADVDFPL
jgi:hypothetical protein